MRLAPALWVLATFVLPACTAMARDNVGGVARRTGLRQAKMPLSDDVDAALRARSDVAKFGPGNCFSTWRNEDGHCEIETHCKDKDISKYSAKFICIDESGEKVRHVFAQGSFDNEEQFDTLIQCKKCLAEKEEKVEKMSSLNGPGTDINYIPPERIDDGGYQVPENIEGEKRKPVGSSKKVKEADKDDKDREDEKDEELDNSGLKALKHEVKELEGFMMNTSAELQKLNKVVYSESYQSSKPNNPEKIGENAAKEAATPAASLVHHSVAHRQHKQKSVEVVEPVRLEVEAADLANEHQRQLKAEENGEIEEAPRPRQVYEILAKKAEAAPPSSLASEMRTAEAHDDKVPASLPARSQMSSLQAVEDNDDKEDSDVDAQDEEEDFEQDAD